MSTSTPSGAGYVRNGNVLAPVTPLAQRPLVAPPQPLTRFIGREGEVAAACAYLLRPEIRLLTLAGPGGIGKTRLALAVAAGVRGHFEGGVAWAPLAAIRDPALVLPAIAQSLGIAAAHYASLADQFPIALHDRRLLLVIDNLEQVVAAAPGIAAILAACPTLTVLATSREPLRISGEQILAVPPLDLPAPGDEPTPERLAKSEAVRLFTERAAAAASGFRLDATTAPIVARICRRLDGLPLAIELAAARVYQLPLDALYDRLERRLPLLTGGPRDAPARLQTMRDAIAWSYDLLPEGEQALFRALATFAGGFALDDVDAIAGEPSLAGLIALVDKSLVRPEPAARGGPRYVMLETIREFAAERLVDSGEADAAGERHARHYLDLATQAHPWLTTRVAPSRPASGETPAWLDRLEADHDNLRGALEWLSHTGRWSDALSLATTLCPFWDIRGHLTEGRAWIELTLGHAGADAAPGLRAEATALLGVFLLRQGDYERAETLLEAARASWLALGDTENLAWLLMFLGGVAEYREDDERARTWYLQALDGFRQHGNVAGVSDTLNNLADTAYRCAGLDEAERLAQEALAIGRANALPVQMGAALVTIGAIACAHGAWDRAVSAHREALRLSRDAGHELNFADACAGLAEVAAATDDPARAARLLGAVQTLADRLGVPRLPHQALHQRAIAAAQAGLEPLAFAAAVAAGRSLAQEETIAEAERVSGLPAAPDVPAAFAAKRLTRRETDVLRLLAAGSTDRAIGEALFIGTRTVESHVSRIFEKLGVRTRTAAVTVALTSGLVEPQPPAGED